MRKLQGKRILVVDDEPIVRLSCKRILEPDGYEVDIASDGYEAMEKIKETFYDVIITDLKMPKMDGFEVLTWIKQNSSGSKIIIITGYSTQEITEKAMSSGAHKYIEKPFTPEALLSTVRELT